MILGESGLVGRLIIGILGVTAWLIGVTAILTKYLWPSK